MMIFSVQYNCIDDDSDQRNPSAHDHFDFFPLENQRRA